VPTLRKSVLLKPVPSVQSLNDVNQRSYVGPAADTSGDFFDYSVLVSPLNARYNLLVKEKAVNLPV